ncbi:MAG: cytochrome b/b6 domain-containing protein [Hyphomicrobiaceae bacterium]
MPATSSPQPRSIATRLMHVSILLIVLHQLLGSSLMEGPRRGRPGDWLYGLHEWGGLIGLGVLGVFWVWIAFRRDETAIAALVPWFSGARLRALRDDVLVHATAVRRRRWPHSDSQSLAAATHGLGLLTALFMAATGASTLVWDAGSGLHGVLIGTHKFLANLMWAYLVAHASIAVLHHLVGDATLREMFTFKKSTVELAKRRHAS